MLCQEPLMDEDEALELLLEANQLTELELFLLETFWTDEPLSLELNRLANQAMQKFLLAQACPPSLSLH